MCVRVPVSVCGCLCVCVPLCVRVPVCACACVCVSFFVWVCVCPAVHSLPDVPAVLRSLLPAAVIGETVTAPVTATPPLPDPIPPSLPPPAPLPFTPPPKVTYTRADEAVEAQNEEQGRGYTHTHSAEGHVGPRSVTIVAHSMGNHLLLQGLPPAPATRAK